MWLFRIIYYGRLLPQEKLALAQLIDALGADISSYQLSFSMTQVRMRGPHIDDLTINCMLRYYQEVRNAQFDSLIGKSLGAHGNLLVFLELVGIIKLLQKVDC